MTFRILQGDCIEQMRTLEPESVQTCVTSPPYYGLRDYGHEGQIGLERSPEEYVDRMVEVFREVRRVLREDGTLWLNIGDSYAAGGMSNPSNKSTLGGGRNLGASDYAIARRAAGNAKSKDLLGIPWMLAFALRDDGWYLRSDIIWHKPNPMPESVRDRPTSAHEHIFLLAKSQRYFYDLEAIQEPSLSAGQARGGGKKYSADDAISAIGNSHNLDKYGVTPATRNRRNVWTVATQPYAGAHFAVFPPKLIEPCVLAGSAEGDTVLDPFAGSGTTGLVALRHNREFIGCELNPEYAQMARHRILDDAPLLNVEAA